MPDPYLLERHLRADLAPLSRRRFLRRSLGLVALAAGGFALLRRSPQDQAALPAGIASLTVAEYLLFECLARVMLPVSDTALPSPGQLPVAANVDHLLSGLRPDIRSQLGMGLALFDNMAVFTHGCRFVDLADADAAAYLGRWINSPRMPQRAIAAALMRLTKTAYWQNPGTWAALSFDGPVSRKWGIPNQGNAPLPG